MKDFTIDFDGTPYPCFLVADPKKAEVVFRQLLSKPGILAADTETAPAPQWKHIAQAALSPHLASPRLIQLFTGTGTVVIDLWRIGKTDLIQKLFHSRPSVFHNMTFDYKMLRQHYGVTDPDMHCTAIMARCVFHAMYPDNKSASLKDVVATLFPGNVINKQAGASDWSIPELTFEQVKYAALDAILQMRVYEKLNDYIGKLGLRKVYDLYRKAQVAICEMELTGLCLDRSAHIKNIASWREELVDAAEEVQRMTGLDTITDAKMGAWLEKTLSPEDLAVWPRSEKTGKIQTDSNVFASFSHLDIVKPFSRYQKLKKLTTSFGKNLLDMVNPATGRLHPTYRVAGAKTGRLSCTEPNIQQQPRSKDMRSVYVPSPGYVMIVSDYSQVEVRCIAEFSNDPRMLDAFQSGLDIYSYTVAGIQGKDIAAVSKQERQSGKALVLGLNYGLGAKKFGHYAKKNYGVDIENPVGLVKAYRDLYSGVREWQMEQVNRVSAQRYTAFSIMGKSRKMTEEDYYGASMNHPVQGSCAEIMLLAIVKARESLKGTSARLLASVHDEIVLECKIDEEAHVKQILKTCMEEAYLEIIPSGRTLNGLVDPTSGSNWADAKE
jgi:DNA polymerase I-like protein with 3'-5' exonuclease and polymerase domains